MKNILFIILLLATSQCIAGISKFELEFGVIGVDKSNEYFISEKTNRIPLRIKDTGFRFGFILNSNTEYETQLKIIFPVAPKILSGSAEVATIEKNILTYPVIQQAGKWSHVSWFDAGDPVGKWEYHLYVNKKLYRSIKFDVFKE